jgi:hypothetical protein
MPVKVRYIGLQPRKSSSRVNEKYTTVWVGHGDVQEVTDEEAAAILKPQYSRIWERVKDEPAPAPAAAPATDTEISELDIPQEPAPAVDPEVEAEKQADAEMAATEKEITPEEVRERLVAILQVIPKLKTSDFGSDGKPKLTALRALMKRPVTALERDTAWDLAKQKAQVPEASSNTEEAEQAPE